MNSKTLGMLAVIILYLIMMIVIGIYYSRKNKDVSNFYFAWDWKLCELADCGKAPSPLQC